MMKTLKRRLLEMEVELAIHRKKAGTFEEEKVINHAIYAGKELIKYLEKTNGNNASDGN